MSLVGGFFGGYTAVMLYELFANAQTQNLIQAVRLAVTGDFGDMALRLLAAAIYVCGLSLSVFVPRMKKINGEYLSVAIDALCIIALFFIPRDAHPIFAAAPIVFAAPYQWTVFDKIEGYVSATIFSSNNFRQFTTSLISYLVDKDREMLKKARVFGLTLLCFLLGTAFVCAAVVLLGKAGVLTGLVPLLIAAIIITLKNRKKSVWH